MSEITARLLPRMAKIGSCRFVVLYCGISPLTHEGNMSTSSTPEDLLVMVLLVFLSSVFY